jgi:hypothetical protein
VHIQSHTPHTHTCIALVNIEDAVVGVLVAQGDDLNSCCMAVCLCKKLFWMTKPLEKAANTCMTVLENCMLEAFKPFYLKESTQVAAKYLPDPVF